jgi:hypothetical protein
MNAQGNGKPHAGTRSIEQPVDDPERMAQCALEQDCLNYDWANNSRWWGVDRPYTAEDVLR